MMKGMEVIAKEAIRHIVLSTRVGNENDQAIQWIPPKIVARVDEMNPIAKLSARVTSLAWKVGTLFAPGLTEIASPEPIMSLIGRMKAEKTTKRTAPTARLMANERLDICPVDPCGGQ